MMMGVVEARVTMPKHDKSGVLQNGSFLLRRSLRPLRW